MPSAWQSSSKHWTSGSLGVGSFPETGKSDREGGE